MSMLCRRFCVNSPLFRCCIRIASMKKIERNMIKVEKKERLLVPVLGFSAVLVSLLAFLVVLYLITIAIRFLFVFG